MKSSLLKKNDLDNSAVGNPMMAKFVPSASARKMAASIKKKTSSFTTKEFEQFSPEATKPSPKDETSAVGVYRHEREAQVLTAKIVERLSPTTTKANSKSRTLVNTSPPNRRISQKMEAERGETSARKEDPERSPLKTKPKDKPLAKKEYLEGFSQKRIKANPKYKLPSTKFPYLNNWTGDDPELSPPKTKKTKSNLGKKPGTEKFKHESELGPHLGRDASPKDMVTSWGETGSPKGGLVAVHTTGRIQELLAINTEVRQPISQAKSIVGLQDTTDILFEDLICTPNPNPSYTPLRYQIDTPSLLKKKILKDQSINKFWGYQLYQRNGKPVQVHYCKTFEMANDIAKLFMKNNVVGFDMEWLSRSIKSESPRYIDFIHVY